MVLDRERDVMAKHVERLQSFLVVRRVAFTTAKSNRSNQLAGNFERRHTLEKFRRNISVRAQESVVRRLGQQYRSMRGAERVNVAGKKRNYGKIRNHRKTAGSHGIEQRRLFEKK